MRYGGLASQGDGGLASQWLPDVFLDPLDALSGLEVEDHEVVPHHV